MTNERLRGNFRAHANVVYTEVRSKESSFAPRPPNPLEGIHIRSEAFPLFRKYSLSFTVLLSSSGGVVQVQPYLRPFERLRLPGPPFEALQAGDTSRRRCETTEETPSSRMVTP